MGDRHTEITPHNQGDRWSETLHLYLGVDDGTLRDSSPEGQLVPTPEEVAEQECQRAERLAAQLRSIGVPPRRILITRHSY